MQNFGQLDVENQFNLIDEFLDKQFGQIKGQIGLLEADLSQWYIFLKLVNRFYNEKERNTIKFSQLLTVEEVKDFQKKNLKEPEKFELYVRCLLKMNIENIQKEENASALLVKFQEGLSQEAC